MEVLDSKVACEGYGIEIHSYRRLDGTEVERQVIDHPGSVAILAHDEEFEGETELECAVSERAEEARLAAAEWSEPSRSTRAPATSPRS